MHPIKMSCSRFMKIIVSKLQKLNSKNKLTKDRLQGIITGQK
jgi:hypothetical protein